MTAPARRRRLLLLATALVGCAAPPPRVADRELDLAVPAQWTHAAPPVEPPGVTPGPAWWTGFGEPRLDELIELALRDNRDLRAALARLEAAAANRTIAGAESLPQLDATFDPSRSRRVFVGFPFGSGEVPSTTATTMSLALNLRWEIDLWGRVRAGESAAIGDLEAAAADHAGAQLSLVALVCRAWFDVVAAAQQVALAEGTAAAVRATADDVRSRYRRGTRPALDVHQAATNQASAEAAALRRRDELQRARRRLDVLVGRYPSGLVDTAAGLPASLPGLPAGLPAELLQRRPDLVAAERRLAAAGCRVDAAKAALYPRLSLTGSAGTTSEELQDLVDQDFRVWSIGANLLQPLFRGGALQAEVLRTQARRAEALADYGGAVLQAFAEVEDALASATLLDDRLAAVTRAAGHARQARDLARERWQLGLTDFLAVADGQRLAYEADAARIDVERLRIDNRIDLFLALGGGVPAAPEATSP